MKKLAIYVLVTIILFSGFISVHAGDKSNAEISVKGGTYDIGVYNVTLVIREDASVQVEEIIKFRFYSGSFSYAYRYINYWKLDDVVNITVGEVKNGTVTWYKEGEHEYGYIVERDPDKVLIKWFYPTIEVNTLTEKTFILKYTATVVIDTVEEFNVLDWDAVPADTPFVAEANVKVIIPKAFDESKLSIDPAPKDVYSTATETVIFFSQKNIPAGNAYRIIVYFPKFIEPRFSLRRFLNENAIIFCLVIIILAIASFIPVWYFKGRDEKVPRDKLKAVGEKYKELAYGGTVPPPDNLRPAEAMVLVRKGIDGRMWIAMLYDLAARGFLKIVQTGDEEIGIEIEKSKIETDSDLRDYERDYLRLIDEIHTELVSKGKVVNGVIPLREFARALRRRNRKLKRVEDKIMTALLDKEFFYKDPRKVRKKWSVIFLIPALASIALLILGAINYIRGLIEMGIIQLFSFIFIMVLASTIFSTRTAKGVIIAEEAKRYSEGLLKKLEYYAKIRKEELENILKEVIEANIGWLLLTRYGRKLIPEEIIRELQGRIYWHPYWYRQPRIHEREVTPIDTASFLTNLNNAISKFITTIGVRGGRAGGAGVGGGGGAGGGGAGAG
ncbi:MAG: DUF2207 family protein [Candidatus Njordarchaeales archaeon]